MRLYNTFKEDGEFRIVFNDELTIVELGQVGEEVFNLIKSEIYSISKVIFDLERVDYIDSSFLSFFIRIYSYLKEENKKFTIGNIGNRVFEIFKISHLDKILKLETRKNEQE